MHTSARPTIYQLACQSRPAVCIQTQGTRLLQRIEHTLLAANINGVGIEATAVTPMGIIDPGPTDIMVHATAPEAHRLRLQHLVDTGLLDLDYLAGEDRPHTILRHLRGWVLFITWDASPALPTVPEQVAA